MLGYNFARYFDLCFEQGMVLKEPRFLLMAFPQAETDKHKAAWLIWWFETLPELRPMSRQQMLQLLLPHMPWYLPYVAFARLRMQPLHPEVKYYSTDRLFRFISSEEALPT